MTSSNALPDVEPPKIPLREKKFARTKLTLMRAAVERLAEKPFCSITVKELCECAQVSEGTFFNYFPRKDDVLKYFIQIWTVEVAHLAEARARGRGLAFIDEVFGITGAQLAENPRTMLEIIGHMALSRELDERCPSEGNELSIAERVQAFTDRCPFTVNCISLDQMLEVPLASAIKSGELPADTPLQPSVLALLSTLFGVPLLLKSTPEEIPRAYRDQLALIWQGVGRRAPSAS